MSEDKRHYVHCNANHNEPVGGGSCSCDSWCKTVNEVLLLERQLAAAVEGLEWYVAPINHSYPDADQCAFNNYEVDAGKHAQDTLTRIKEMA